MARKYISVLSARKHTRMWIILSLFFATTVPSAAQTSCSSRTVTKSNSIVEQVLSFLADEKVAVTGDGLAFLAMINENPRIEAIGHAVDVVHFIAEQINKNQGRGVTTLELCSVPQSVKPPQGYRSLSILGTQTDMQTIGGSSSRRSMPSVADLLKPYESQNKSIPSFPTISPPSIGNSTPQQQGPWRYTAPIQILAAVAGSVLDEHGNEIAGAVVSLTPSTITSAQPQWRMTRDDGSYSFEGAPGEYFISARLASSISGGELDSGSATVSLTTASASKVNLYVHPHSRAETEEGEVSAEQKAMIIDFIAAADRAEWRASREGNPGYLEDFYTGEALKYANGTISGDMERGAVAWLNSGHVEAIRYFPKTLTILVDTVEVWSYTVVTDEVNQTHTGRPSPQTITIRQTPWGMWYISEIQFHDVSNSVH
jgi:hypothetical protein